MKNYYLKKALLLVVSVSILLVAGRKILPILVGKTDDDNLFLFHGSIKFILLLFTVYTIKKDKIIHWEFTFKNLVMSSVICALLVLLSLQHTFSISAEQKVSATNLNLFPYTFQCLSTGFFEEFFFRILIFSYICKTLEGIQKGKNYKAVLITSFLFSIAHLTNVFSEEFDTVSVINQILFAFAIGIFFQCLFFKWKNIYLLSFMHAAVNFNGMIKSTLFKIEDHSLDNTPINNFIQTMIVLVIFTALLVIPILYFGLKNKQNELMGVREKPE